MINRLYNNQFASLAFGLGLLAFGGSATAEICGTPQVVTLFAGQTIEAGNLTVSNDATNLYITYTSADPWWLAETHLHVADSLAGIPQTRKGNPVPGNFQYSRTYDPLVREDTHTIPKSDLSLDDNNSVIVAGHAVVVQLDASGDLIASETGWGDGKRFVDRGSWATYFSYQWQQCNAGGGDGESTETAFAFGDSYASCFIGADFDEDGVDDGFNRWGWTNGPLAAGSYTFDIYAAAGQCSLLNGTLVGNLTIDYDGAAATVTFTMTEADTTTGVAYNMVETHLYVGSEPLAPDGNGNYTVAPGQYPNVHDELANVVTDGYTITGLSGDVYVVAHATVAGFPSD